MDWIVLILGSIGLPFIILLIIFGVLPAALIQVLELIALISNLLYKGIRLFGKKCEELLPSDPAMGFLIINKKTYAVIYVLTSIALFVYMFCNM